MLVYNPKVLDNIQPLQSNMWVMDIYFLLYDKPFIIHSFSLW